jgi:DNA-binding beta-propeller fold protein YncE
MFSEPWGVVVANDGTIYVADTWYHRVLMFAPDGSLVKQWGFYEQTGIGVPSGPFGFYGPRDIKLDAQGNVYIADTGNKRVRVYDRDGNFLRDIGTTAIAGNMKEPVGIAIDSELQEIYIASTWSKKIEVYSLLGDYKREWTLRAWAATTEQTDSGNRPFLALDRTGRYLFVTDPDVGRILVFEASNGNPVLQFGRLGTAPNYTTNQFGALGGIALDPISGKLLLTDAGSARVLRFDPLTLPGLSSGLPQIPVTAAPVTTEPAVAITEDASVGTAESNPDADATPEATAETTSAAAG